MPIANLIERREYNRVWIQNRRDAYFKDKVCAKCGKTTELELDHIDPETKISNSIWSWSEARRNTEIAKCQVLCSEHHKEKTKAYLQELFTKPTKHGTSFAYLHKACRCDICKAFYVTYRREKYLRIGK